MAATNRQKTLLGGPLQGLTLKVKEPCPKVVSVVLVRGIPEFAIPGVVAPYLGSYVLTDVQQKTRVVQKYFWHERYPLDWKMRFGQLSSAEQYARLRRAVLLGSSLRTGLEDRR